MSPQRSKIPPKIISEVMKLSTNRCCVCGISNVQIHHLDEDRGNNQIDNLCPLCPNHHAEVHSKKNLTQNWKPEYLKRIRNDFYQKIKQKKFMLIYNQYKREFSFLAKYKYSNNLLVKLNKRKELNFQLFTTLPRGLEKLFFNTSRLFFSSWDEFWIIHNLKGNLKKENTSDESMKIIIYRSIEQFQRIYCDPLLDCFVIPEFKKESDFKRFKNIDGKVLKDKIIRDIKNKKIFKRFKVNLNYLNIYDSVYTKVNLILLNVISNKEIVASLIIRFDILKEIPKKFENYL